jgi:hypothetical protein
MQIYKRRLVSVLPNTDDTLFAVYSVNDDTAQYKVKVKFIAFYEEKWNEESEWELRNMYLTHYEGSNDCIYHAEDSCGFLGYIGGGTEDIEMAESEYLPFPKKKVATAATRTNG